MDRNTLLAFALSFAVLTLWMLFTTPAQRKPADATTTPTAEEAAEGPPLAVPVPVPEPRREAPAGLERPSPVVRPVEAQQGEQVVFETPLFRAELDSVGAILRHFELKQYRVSPKEGSPPVVLTTGQPPYANALATPFAELGIGDLSQVAFAVERLGELGVRFSHERNGILVSKEYAFDAANYAFALRVNVRNGSQQPIGPQYAVSWPAHVATGHDFVEQSLAALHDGSLLHKPLAAFGTPGFFDRSPETQELLHNEVDWAGVTTTYFVCAILPDDPGQASAQLVATEPGRSGIVQVFFDAVTLPPGQSAERVFRVYVGPKEAERLESLGGGLIRSIDLGWNWLAPLTLAFGWLLRALHSLIPNYGVGIILLTVMVRAVTTPLTMKQMRSMERMRALQPKLQELKEKHPDDRQKQSEEMMQLYRREGVNPLGGCLPMILQLPVFIGLFYALRSSIDLRQAPFVGWINDLSAPDALFEIPGIGIPLRVLPLVMGATMVVQQRITPMQVDPAQAKMMMTVMPVMMTVLFYQFPSGLVLYWMVSNVLAIAHQLWVGRTLRTAKA
jgi:YidC/Oxa1 family membrane protein insertase